MGYNEYLTAQTPHRQTRASQPLSVIWKTEGLHRPTKPCSLIWRVEMLRASLHTECHIIRLSLSRKLNEKRRHIERDGTQSRGKRHSDTTAEETSFTLQKIGATHCINTTRQLKYFITLAAFTLQIPTIFCQTIQALFTRSWDSSNA